MSSSILLVDAEADARETVSTAFRDDGHEVAAVATGEEAVGWLGRRHFDLVIAALTLPGLSGFHVLEHARRHTPPVPVMVLTEEASLEAAVRVMRMGASDYVIRPITLEELKSRAQRALEAEPVAAELEAPTSAALIGESRGMRTVRRLIARIATSPSNVLITGESGTGKELVARAIHAASPRHARPFVGVNCGAIPEGLMESQLFGHIRGAFTSAVQGSAGLLLAANGGTFLLDEIGDLPLGLQVKLLRVIEDREVWAVGATRPAHVDVRIIASTNRDLRGAVEAGRFREDLFYRLNVVHVTLPPLRERAADVPLLTEHFITKLNAKLGTTCTGVDPGALRVLMAYRWRGNVRELENVLERAIGLGESGVIGVRDLPEELRAAVGGGPAVPTLREALHRFEHLQILDALERSGFDKRLAARRLGISLASLYRKLAGDESASEG